mgnify:CR=1 FL=1
MGGIVNGLVIQTKATEMGRFARKYSAMMAAIAICPGVGIHAANRPIAKAAETERRFKCQRLGSWSLSPKKLRFLFSLMDSDDGMYFFNSFFGMTYDSV